MAANEQNNSNGTSRKLSFEPPSLEIPANIRSSRLLPRVIALAAVAAWLIVLYAGTAALAKREQNSGSGQDTYLQAGPSWYGIVAPGDEGRCLGFMRSELKKEKLLTIRTVGAFHLRFGPTLFLVELRSNVRFSEYSRLVGMELEALVGDGIVRAVRIEEEVPTLEVSVDLKGVRQKRSLPFPDPIFLLEKESGQYVLRVPPNMSSRLNGFLHQQTILGQTLGISFIELDSDAVKQCREQVLKSKDGDPKSAIEVGKYFRLMDFDFGRELSENSDEQASN